MIRHTSRRLLGTAAAALALITLAACGDDLITPEGTTSVAFRAATSGAAVGTSPGDVAFSHAGDPDVSVFQLEGTNGRLSLVSVHFIVSEFELERADADDDCDDVVDDDDCEEFEADPRFLELPLTGDAAVAVQHSVPAGLYDELEFEIEDLDDDDDGDDDSAAILDLMTEVRDQFPEWPADGSLRIHGTFTPVNEEGDLVPDQATDFTVYFEAEIEIEKEFASPVEITSDGGAFTVTVDPRIWFERANGTVRDLSQLDFDPEAGGPVPELEVEIESEVGEGFAEVEFGG